MNDDCSTIVATATPTAKPTDKPVATNPPAYTEPFIGICKQWGTASSYYFTYANGTPYGPNPWGKNQEVWFGGKVSQVSGQSFKLWINGKIADSFTIVPVGDKAWCRGNTVAKVPPSGSSELPPTQPDQPNFGLFGILMAGVSILLFAVGWKARS